MERFNTKPSSKGPIRVIQVASGDLWAGAEAQLYQLVGALSELEGVEVEVILLNFGPLEAKLKQSGIDVSVYDESVLNGFAILFRIFKHCIRRKPDILHTHRLKENILGAIATLAQPKMRTIRTVHGMPEDKIEDLSFFQKAIRQLDVFCGRYFQNRIVAVSAALQKELVRQFPASKVVAIENGLSFRQITARAQTKVSLPCPDECLKVAFVGRLTAVKRPDLFVEIAALSQDKIGGDGAHFFIFGEGPLEEGIRDTIQRKGLQAQTHLMGFKENVSAYLARMDLMLITSDHEGLPMALLEAMCLKVPIIAHAVGSIPDVLSQGQFGTLIDTQDAQQFADVVADFSSDKSPLRQKAQQGYEHAVACFPVERTAERYHELYRQVMP